MVDPPSDFAALSDDDLQALVTKTIKSLQPPLQVLLLPLSIATPQHCKKNKAKKTRTTNSAFTHIQPAVNLLGARPSSALKDEGKKKPRKKVCNFLELFFILRFAKLT